MEVLSNLIDQLVSPVCIVFAVTALGCLCGKIRVYGFALDLSAVLLAAVLAGTLIGFAVDGGGLHLPEQFHVQMQSFSALGTSLFAAAVGLSGGYTAVRDVRKGTVRFFCMGIIMAASGMTLVPLIQYLEPEMDLSLLGGMFTGAVTSTPGLSAICEADGVAAGLAVIGYGSTYVFGAVGTVLSVQILSRRYVASSESKTLDVLISDDSSVSLNEMITLAVIVIGGRFLGGLTIPMLDFSLGNTAGILCVGVLAGRLTAKRKRIPNSHIALLRSFGLLLFLTATGIPAGMSMLEAVQVKMFLYGVMMTTIPIAVGFVIAKYVLHLRTEELVCVIAGGMTSTPAVGSLLQKNTFPVNMTAYSMTYIGALFTVVIGMRKIFA